MTLIDMARTMLGEFKTRERFWSEAVNTACHAINRVYLHRLLKKTSYEVLTGNKPNVSYFRVFGSKCYILVKKGRNSKFAPKAVEGFLLGYDSTAKWCGREEEQDAHRHGEDDAWRIQDARAVLVGSCEHGLPCHKSGLPSSPPQEDVVQTSNG